MATDHEANQTLEEWAKSQHLALTLAFTDIVRSTSIGVKLGDNEWIKNLFCHFSQARLIASDYDCYIVKAIGDSLMRAFRTSSEAVKFAMAFSVNTGVPFIGIRVGINSGEVQIKDNDIYGLNVNFTSRVQSIVEREGILVSGSVTRDYVKTIGSLSGISFVEEEYTLKSFGKETLYRTEGSDLNDAWLGQRRARARILMAKTSTDPLSGKRVIS